MIVVAGVTGHVGSVVAKELLAKGSKIKVLARDAEKAAAWSTQGAEVAVGALGDAAFLTRALKGATAFFTLLPTNVMAADIYADQRKTADVIASAVKANAVPHVVMLSSVGADVAEGNGPIKGLHHLENALRATGTKLSAIRAGSFQENIANALAPAKNMGFYPSFAPNAELATPLIATRDIGALAAKLLLDPPTKSENVDLLGPAYSSRQIAEKLGKALGKTLSVMDVPQAGWVDAMMQGGMPKHAAEVFAEMYAGFAAGKLAPHGDRMVQGTTTLDEVLETLVA